MSRECTSGRVDAIFYHPIFHDSVLLVLNVISRELGCIGLEYDR